MRQSATYDHHRALELLRDGTGQRQAVFREGQEAAIRHVVEGRGRLLVVERTGWGKSFVYFIATKLLRERGAGPALLISPLLALMRNQIAAAERMGVRAIRITSDNYADWQKAEERLLRDEADILLISPKRLDNERFRTKVLTRIAARISLLVIDEAHCISDWGHDFMPHYRLIERTARALPPNMRVLATTATANDRVMDDLRSVLGPNLRVHRGDLNRPSLMLQSIRLAHQSERLAWLAEQLPQLPGSGVIYTLTIRDAGRVAEWLRSRGLAVKAYTGQTGSDREALEQALLDNEVKALVATPALGMGFDKPDLGFVIHYQTPGSVVTYYQQVGRAGRALDSAYGVLLSGEEDTDITGYFIDRAFPTREEVRQVIEALEAAPNGLSVPELEGTVNLSQGRIEKTILLLSIESPAPIAKQGTKWQLTPATLGEEFWERTARLTALRHEEQRQMQEYAGLESGHMEFLIRALDGNPASVRPPDLPPLPTEVEPGIMQDALTFLRRTSLPIQPRQQWPAGGMLRLGVRGKIPAARHAQPGKALSIWGDAGWGGLVQRGKYRDGRFADDLVHACASLMGQWAPKPAPEWVTCIPSQKHPDLVPDFAKRLAERIGLPFYTALTKVEDRPEQKSMANSAYQARNVDGSLSVSFAPLPAGPVLLVDDMVDSRWTFTVAAWLLRSNGSGEVWPLALAWAG